ncbi:MAG: chloride channel protein [Lachnospiraceae bacterium]|nr:chloride channel protein [Lachnospiraceae bacterium]
MENKESKIQHKLKHNLQRALSTIKWIIFSFIVGGALGVVGALFHHGIAFVTDYRLGHSWVLYLLPVGAILIALIYKLCGYENDGGTNVVIASIHSDERVPLRMSGLIFLSTIFSHFCGASVGREGAALQVGGSLGYFIGKCLRFNERDKKTMVMVGMSAVFSALFGTPFAAAIFSMEVVSVGIMHYAALLPCTIASLTARYVAARLGAPAPFYEILSYTPFHFQSALKVGILASLCGLVSILFCVSLHKSSFYAKKFIPNRYLRGLIGGVLMLGITLLIGTQEFNGAGTAVISDAIGGETTSYAFLLKIVATSICIAAGYKGGEIVPTFYIGATFGCLFGQLAGISPSMCAAIGMGAMFCGVTNSPITAFLICLELFGFEGANYFLLAIAFSYVVSGYFGLYSSQKIVYSKFKSNFINKMTE